MMDREPAAVDLSWCAAAPWPLLLLSGDGRMVLQANAAGMRWWAGPMRDGQGLQALVHAAIESGQANGPVACLIDGQPQTWAVQIARDPDGLRLVAQHLAWWPELQRQRDAAQADQRDLIVREVHHRIKNNLQGLAGLLGRLGQAHPPLAPAVQRAVQQVQAWAQVHGLQAQSGQDVLADDLLQAAVTSLGELFGVEIPIRRLQLPTDGRAESGAGEDPARRLLWAHLDEEGALPPQRLGGPWRLRESDATALALCLHELLVNAVKHRSGPVEVERLAEPGAWAVEIRNAGRWVEPEAASQGLALVRMLMPRRGARLEVRQDGPWVCARLHIGPPCAWASPVTPAEPATQSTARSSTRIPTRSPGQSPEQGTVPGSVQGP